MIYKWQSIKSIYISINNYNKSTTFLVSLNWELLEEWNTIIIYSE